jgi:hypothetical protein
MSSNLWAQPSKEWVIPARPKPGRKPKKDEGLVLQQTIIAQVEDEQVKKAQNRYVTSIVAVILYFFV